ncbi:MAG: hypothetical protein JWM26_815 [Betaproteobacteria bacterium]|nr:hypothetical protein [Betaproteobacteria bacterium]
MAQRPEADPKMDSESLYREDIVTDRKVGTIRMLTPLKTDGTTDTARPVLYMGEAQIMTGAGPLPISFEIEVSTLAEAVEQFGDAAKDAIEKTVRDLQEMRRQQASSIVVPQGPLGGLGPGGLGGGGGGGKIQMP